MLDEICRTYTRVSGLGAEDATPLDLQLMLQPTNVIIYGTKAKAEMAFFIISIVWFKRDQWFTEKSSLKEKCHYIIYFQKMS